MPLKSKVLLKNGLRGEAELDPKELLRVLIGCAVPYKLLGYLVVACASHSR